MNTIDRDALVTTPSDVLFKASKFAVLTDEKSGKGLHFEKGFEFHCDEGKGTIAALEDVRVYVDEDGCFLVTGMKREYVLFLSLRGGMTQVSDPEAFEFKPGDVVKEPVYEKGSGFFSEKKFTGETRYYTKAHGWVLKKARKLFACRIYGNFSLYLDPGEKTPDGFKEVFGKQKPETPKGLQ
jgi:hypothetical protein